MGGKTQLHKPHTIAWDWIRKLKNKGGLGMRNCHLWKKDALGNMFGK